MRVRILLVCSLPVLTALTISGQGQSQSPQILAESLAGSDSFALYCAPCHGRTGHGDGPVAAALRAKPPNLTRLAQRSGGAFPTERVQAFVTGTGRSPAAHGTTEMPIWGPLFRAYESDVRVRERIANLVTHIESLQQGSSGLTIQGRGCSQHTARRVTASPAVATAPLRINCERHPPISEYTGPKRWHLSERARAADYRRPWRCRAWRSRDGGLGGCLPKR